MLLTMKVIFATGASFLHIWLLFTDSILLLETWRFRSVWVVLFRYGKCPSYCKKQQVLQKQQVDLGLACPPFSHRVHLDTPVPLLGSKYTTSQHSIHGKKIKFLENSWIKFLSHDGWAPLCELQTERLFLARLPWKPWKSLSVSGMITVVLTN